MKDTEASDKKATDTTTDAQRIEQIAALVHKMRTTGCQAIDVLGQAEADPSATVTDPERETRQLIGQLGTVLSELAEVQEAAETAIDSDKTDDAETNGGGLGELFDGGNTNNEGSDLRGFE